MSEYVGLAVQGVSALAGAYSQYKAGQKQAEIAQSNVSLTTEEAVNTINEYSFEASKKRDEGKRAVASLRAAEAHAGFQQTGTAAWLQEETMSEYEKDAQAIFVQGLNRSKATMGRAGIYAQQGKVASTAGAWNSAATLLNGVSNAIKIS